VESLKLNQLDAYFKHSALTQKIDRTQSGIVRPKQNFLSLKLLVSTNIDGTPELEKLWLEVGTPLG
jgi:hypothetical protein